MMTKLRSTKIVNFMTPGRGDPLPGRGHKGHDGKYIIPLKIFKMVTFIAPGAGVLILGCGYISNLVKIFFSTPRHTSDILFIK